MNYSIVFILISILHSIVVSSFHARNNHKTKFYHDTKLLTRKEPSNLFLFNTNDEYSKISTINKFTSLFASKDDNKDDDQREENSVDRSKIEDNYLKFGDITTTFLNGDDMALIPNGDTIPHSIIDNDIIETTDDSIPDTSNEVSKIKTFGQHLTR